jgi:hypothetical protein
MVGVFEREIQDLFDGIKVASSLANFSFYNFTSMVWESTEVKPQGKVGQVTR